ncbi:MAG: alanine racemase, partial [Clostridia bacterium]|nr:alanine racemase [Clostridia bacterium]
MDFTLNRTWVEIDLDALAFNMRSVRERTEKNALVTAVVKADAYGHGAVEVSRVLLENGADRLAVACISEAKQLRRNGFDVPILILGASEACDAEELVENDVTAAVFSYSFAKALSDAAAKCGKTAKVHIKLDTGMSRIGMVAGENEEAAIAEIKRIAELPNLEIEGIFSHFSTSDESNGDYTKRQFDIFIKFCDRLKESGVDIPLRHIANSAAIMMYPESHLDMVRAGIVLYGLYPSDEVDKRRLPLVPVMRMKSHISMVKEKEAGWGVSYGKEYITEGRTKIATVPVGYADGYTRAVAKKGKILLKDNTLAKIIGRICMDQCMIDVTNVNNINAGDEVTLFGADKITADDIAAWTDTINYEVVCLVSKRVPRIY